MLAATATERVKATERVTTEGSDDRGSQTTEGSPLSSSQTPFLVYRVVRPFSSVTDPFLFTTEWSDPFLVGRSSRGSPSRVASAARCSRSVAPSPPLAARRRTRRYSSSSVPSRSARRATASSASYAARLASSPSSARRNAGISSRASN